MSTDATLPPTDPQDPEPAPGSALGRLRAATEAVAEPLVEGVGAVIGSAIESFRESSGRRARRLGRLGREPLPSLPDLYPDARRARPVEIGLRTVDVAAIRGTAVGGGDQRGADFLPMRKFRGHNWRARWQRLRRAHDALSHAPPHGVGDRAADLYHVGYGGYRWLLDRSEPPLWLHGHVPPASVEGRRVVHGHTQVVNVTGAVLIEVGPPAAATSE